MSNICQICGRNAQVGFSRSHSNIASKRKFSINLQSKKVEGKKIKICAKCLKTQNKV